MMTIVYKIIANIPQTNICLDNYFDEKRLEESHLRLLSEIEKIEFDDSKQKSSFEDAIQFNCKRLAKAKSTLNRKRFETRDKHLNELHVKFEENNEYQFMALVGWGKGCVSTSLKKHHDLSAVDGVLYKNNSTGDTHYLRLGSSLEQYLKHRNDDSETSGHFTMTDFGVDINLSKHQFLNHAGESVKSDYEHNLFEVGEEDHGDHKHPTLINKLDADLNKISKNIAFNFQVKNKKQSESLLTASSSDVENDMSTLFALGPNTYNFTHLNKLMTDTSFVHESCSLKKQHILDTIECEINGLGETCSREVLKKLSTLKKTVEVSTFDDDGHFVMPCLVNGS